MRPVTIASGVFSPAPHFTGDGLADVSSTRDGLGSEARAAVEELRTITDLVRWGAARLGHAGVAFGHGTDNAVDEALVLVLHAAGLYPRRPRIAVRLASDRERAPRGGRSDSAPYPRSRARPLPDGTGMVRGPGVRLRCSRSWFRGPPSRSGSSAASSPGSIRTRSVGCWTSAPAAAPSPSPCAMAFPNAAVDAVDVSDAALELARENCVAHDVGDRVGLFASDVYTQVSGHFDLIVSNPPYVDAGTMATLDPEYLHEPRIGLEAGADGLDCVRRVLAGASDHLRPGGVLVCEVGAVPGSARARVSHCCVHVARSFPGRGGRIPAGGGADRGARTLVSGPVDELSIAAVRRGLLPGIDPLKLNQLVDKLEVDKFPERHHGRGGEPSIASRPDARTGTCGLRWTAASDRDAFLPRPRMSEIEIAFGHSQIHPTGLVERIAGHPTGQFHLAFSSGNGAKLASLEPIAYLPLFVRHFVAHDCLLPR